MLHVFRQSESERARVQHAARLHAATFADAEFEKKMKAIYADFIPDKL
jgi:hypothetical protein